MKGDFLLEYVGSLCTSAEGEDVRRAKKYNTHFYSFFFRHGDKNLKSFNLAYFKKIISLSLLQSNSFVT